MSGMPNYPVPGEAIGFRRLLGQIWYRIVGEIIKRWYRGKH